MCLLLSVTVDPIPNVMDTWFALIGRSIPFFWNVQGTSEHVPGVKSSYDQLEMTHYQLFQSIACAGQTMLNMELLELVNQLLALSKPSRGLLIILFGSCHVSSEERWEMEAGTVGGS